MFLYARLVLNHLRRQATWDELEEEANCLPAGLDEAYAVLLEKSRYILTAFH
jgi:hypothetical protein